jgi:hypothetical protein
VVVTARENYGLMRIEQHGVSGPGKYAAAGITWAGDTPIFVPVASGEYDPTAPETPMT